jgi:protein-disulfide isomerase/uncharacterized membrane protein
MLMETTGADAVPPRFVQPKPWIRWLAVILAAAGWYVSLYSFRIAAGNLVNDPLMRLVCGGDDGPGGSDCTAVLTSPQAYVPLSRQPGAPRIPLGAFGMCYFAALLLWYLFVGPPTRPGRYWHLLVTAVVLCGACYSAYYIHVMANVLHRWCNSCLAAHGLNGGLILLTLLAWPWRSPPKAVVPHPTARLALGTALAGVLAFATHMAIVLLGLSWSLLDQRTKDYAAIIDDSAYVLWDFHRQPEVSLPLYDDEVFAGSPTAANTIVEFSDFQCPQCRQAHEMFVSLAGKYPDRFRLAFRYCPQDSECNPDPRWRGAAHASACRAARAAEAARAVGGREAYLNMRKKLWDHQSELPTVPFAQQTEAQRRLFEDWAAELGLDRAAFAAAMDSPAVAARIQKDIAAAERLGLSAMPVVYVNGKRLRNWSKKETWDALLAGPEAPLAGETPTPPQPASAPVTP